MRRLFLVLGAMTLTSGASAADLPVLRGPIAAEVVPIHTWQGFYAGGQVGYSVSGMDFSGSAAPLINNMLRDTAINQDQHISSWSVLAKDNPGGASFGAFAGYNWEWEDAVLGFELNYNRTSLTGSSSDSISRSFTDKTNLPPGHLYNYNISIGAASTAQITDFGTFRVRGGWDAGPFLPYAFAAFAVGRVNTSTSASLSGTATDFISITLQGSRPLDNLTVEGCAAGSTDAFWLPTDPDVFPPSSPCTQTISKKGAFAYGGAAGLGLDVAVVENVFFRAEWEWVQFAPLLGMHLHINTIRTALGIRF